MWKLLETRGVLPTGLLQGVSFIVQVTAVIFSFGACGDAVFKKTS